MKMYYYKKCSTCRNAIKFLEKNNIIITNIDYTEHPLTLEELKDILVKSGSDIKKMFNTSGLIYRDLGLKDKLTAMSENEKLLLLSKNPMLIKRPLVITDTGVLFGFKEEEWKSVLL